jgi:hypothetical protein
VTARARGHREGQRDDRAEARALLELLAHGLSQEEIQRVLASALLALDERGRDRLLTRLGAETGATLRRLLASRGRTRTKAPPAPGSAKIREEWDKAWSEWEACVAESGDEDGRYVVREHHWEEPYLDGSSLAQDLEPLAARMRKSASHWAKALGAAHSGWFKIHQALAKRWDPRSSRRSAARTSRRTGRSRSLSSRISSAGSRSTRRGR